MVRLRRFVAALLVLTLVLGLVLPPSAQATVGTDQAVFNLTSSGVAKLALAESQVATAVSILGMLGRISSVVSVGFVAYEVTTGFWDWWNRDYNQGTTTFSPAVGEGAWGINTGANKFRILSVSPEGVGYPYSPSFAGKVQVGQEWEWNGLWRDLYVYWIYGSPFLTAASGSNVSGPSNRVEWLAELDQAIQALTVADRPVTVNGLEVASQGQQASLIAGLQAGRDVISNGVALVPSDYVGSPGVAGDPATAGAQPGAIPSPTESPTAVDVSGAVAAASAAVAAAIAASQAAVVSAVSAVSSAIAASQAAVVSAVQAVAAPIVEAIAASQAAVVSAVNAVTAAVSGVTSHVDDVKIAVDGVKASVDALTAQEAAPDTTAPALAPAVTCPACVRDDKWSDAWMTLRDAGQAAPVFGLINRIVINPSGTIQRIRTVNTANFGALTFDLSAWGIDTYIGVVRYVVIFVALMAGYFVIFG